MRYKQGREWKPGPPSTPHRPVGHNAVELRDASPILAKVPAKGRAVKAGTIPPKDAWEHGHGLLPRARPS